uniref:mitogen-activated protein kinase kinase kinase n=1 Tax=Davidia involucrata TaxID=16924 RepID=A0A5B7B4K5_DAVIN
MRWWQNAFSSSSSSSSSSSKRHSDNTHLHLHKFSKGLRSQRRLTRARRLRHLGDNDVGVADDAYLDRPGLRRSSSSTLDNLSPQSLSVGPQPLPLPELAMLLRRDANSTSGNVPLPSPKEAPSRGGEERERADGLIRVGNGDGVTTSSGGLGSSSASQDARKNTDHAETRSSRKVPQELRGLGRIRDNYRLNVPISAPTSPFSSPTLSPKRSTRDIFVSHYTSPQVFQVWSAPEMPYSDTTLCLGFPQQMSSEKTAFSFDNSPLHSPIVSPCPNTRSSSGPASPLHNKLSLETATSWHECNAQASVHPLPLPPGAAMPSQQALVSQVTAKPESIAMKCQWQKGKLIGRGTFGSVYVATNTETGALCAMKEVELFPEDPTSAECIKQLEQEIKVLSQLKHPNIVQYYGSEMVEDKFCIYLEYVHPGSINKYVTEHCGAITESVVRNFTRHILSGLAYLHSTKTIHRDIKGANLLVDAYGVVKLADFGMAKHLSGQASKLSLKGSPYWMAPELLQSVGQKDTSSDLALAVDIWSLGCTIIEMLNGKPPWSEYEAAAAMFKVLRETPHIPEKLSSEGKDFLRCCFCRNPAERPSASNLLEHPFLKNSQQLDVPSCTQALSGMKLTDRAHTSRVRLNYKLERLLASPEAQATKGKAVNK